MPLDIEAIKARLAAATPGPWRQQLCACGSDCDEHASVKAGGSLVATCAPDADADLIANTPQDLAALIAEVERLRRGTSWYAPTLVLGVPTAPVDALIADRSEEDQEAFWDALDVCHDLYREISYVPVMARDGRLEDVVAVEIADLAARYADELRSARAEWADVAAHAEERGVVLPEARLYLVSMEVSGG